MQTCGHTRNICEVQISLYLYVSTTYSCVSLTTCSLTRSSISVLAISQHPHGVSLYQAPCLYLEEGGLQWATHLMRNSTGDLWIDGCGIQ